MTHFDYISVAAALIFALAFGELASGISRSLHANRFYWVHAAWMIGLLLVGVLQWWTIWDMRMIPEWTPVKFLWLLMMPSLLLIRSSLLVGGDPNSIESYEAHFYRIRIRFFALGILSACYILLSPWVLAGVPISTFSPAHAQGLMVLCAMGIGLIFSRPSIQGALAILSILIPIAGFWIV